ncbi:hypothetical protein FRB99_000975 [Tulasnella sp. 403]|nr:hypothetical protein FRB99_000975 [Tulasnella sp. 403]
MQFVQSSPEPEPETETESDVDGEPLHFTHLPPTLPPPSQVTTKSSRAAPKRSKPVAVRNKTKSAVKHTVRARSARGTVKQTVGVTPKRSTRRTATISTESSSDSSTHSGNAKTSTRRKYEIWEREVVAEQIAAFVQRHSRLPSHELVEWAVVRDMCREASKTKVVVIDKKTVIGPEFLKSAKGIQKYASRRKIVISQREKDLTAKAHSR